MDILEDLKLVYSKSFKNCKELLIKNPIALILPMIFSLIINFILARFFYPFIAFNSLLGGLIYGLVYSAILSIYFSAISDLIYYRRLKISNIFSKRNILNYLTSIYLVYVISSWINLFTVRFLIINIILYILFNCVAESIFIKDEQYIEAFSYSFNFIKENIIQWIIPLMIYGLVSSLIFSTDFVLNSLQSQNYIAIALGFNAEIPILNDVNYLLKYILFYIVTGFYVVFRATLFKILSESTLRKRKYMGEA